MRRLKVRFFFFFFETRLVWNDDYSLHLRISVGFDARQFRRRRRLSTQPCASKCVVVTFFFSLSNIVIVLPAIEGVEVGARHGHAAGR